MRSLISDSLALTPLQKDTVGSACRLSGLLTLWFDFAAGIWEQDLGFQPLAYLGLPNHEYCHAT
jgi:hypothetical protein